MRTEMCLMFWKFGNLALEKFWKIFGIFLKELV